MTHTINIKITPICTACGKELQTSGLKAKSTGHPFERDCPEDRTEQRLFVYACQECFVFKGDLEMNNWYDKASEQIQNDHTEGLISDKEYYQQMRDLDAEYQEYVQQEVDSYRDSFY